ncbi:hypothetical protein ASE73_16555 [Sphingomonas sp. Leaf24]|nr:hypothetical protein ASE50_15770 [Sphingomonas sp. Leaf5]KQM76084.1 hypothetical protein ASE70_09740 [Sphingomonas sp. Leaf22]KQM93176.1 hypothetical protein ASE73_16555 [Sphingomonas sp. Leaf24]
MVEPAPSATEAPKATTTFVDCVGATSTWVRMTGARMETDSRSSASTASGIGPLLSGVAWKVLQDRRLY